MLLSFPNILSTASKFLIKIRKSDFIRKVIETFLTRVSLIGIGLITSVIVARILGPERKGLFALATALAAMGVQLGNMGLHASNTYYVAKTRDLLPTLVSNTLMVSFVFGSSVSFLIWVSFSFWPNFAPVYGSLLILSLVWIPFGLANMLLQNLLIGIQEIRTYNIIQLISKILTVSLICTVIIFRITSVKTIFSVGLITQIISFIWVLLRLKPYLNHLPCPSFTLFKDNLRYGIKAYISAFAAFLVFKMDLFLIDHYLGAKEAGLYSIAVNIANMINLFPIVVGTIFFPKLCALSDWTDKLRFVKKVTIGMFSIMLVVTLIAIFIADFIISLLYGHAYATSAIPFKWLMLGILILSVECIVRRLLISDGYRIGVVYAWLITFAVNIALNILLIPKMGIKGAAVASSLSLMLLAVMTTLMVRKFVVQTHCA